MIPKILHQIWIGDPPSTQNQLARNSILELYPDWANYYHTDESILTDLEVVKEFGDLTIWSEEAAKICKEQNQPWRAITCDLLKLLIVWKHGGVFFDHDMFGVQPVTESMLSERILLGAIMEHPHLLVSEAVIGAAPKAEELAYAVKRYTRQPPLSGYICVNFARVCRDLKWKWYSPDIFVPHGRSASGEELYKHNKDTCTIHLWNRNAYDFERLYIIRKALRA